MIRADENMLEMTDDELCEWRERLQYEEYEADAEAAADDAQAERRNPHADQHCPYCHGTGTVTDWVPWGMGHTPMPSPCDCIDDLTAWVEDSENDN